MAVTELQVDVKVFQLVVLLADAVNEPFEVCVQLKYPIVLLVQRKERVLWGLNPARVLMMNDMY